MTYRRRCEIVLLVIAGTLTALGMSLVCVREGDGLVRATRSLSVAGALIVSVFIMDIGGRKRDRLLLPIVAMLCGISVMLLWGLDARRGVKQIVWIAIGSAAMLGVYKLIGDIRKLQGAKLFPALLGVGLLLGALAGGGEALSLHIPQKFGLVGVDIGVVVKLFIVVSLTTLGSDYARLHQQQLHGSDGARFAKTAMLAAMAVVALIAIVGLIFAHRVIAAIVIGSVCVTVIYLATRDNIYPLIAAVTVAVIVVTSVLLFSSADMPISDWLSPSQPSTEAGRGMSQGLDLLREGGSVGRQQLQNTPPPVEGAETDLIFAAIGRRLGLAGACGTLCLFAVLTYTGFRIAWRSRDRFGTVLGAGATTAIALQAILAAAGPARLVPLAGGTLPFVSYGGTAMLVNFIIVGLLLAVSRDCKQPLHNSRASHRLRVTRRRSADTTNAAATKNGRP